MRSFTSTFLIHHEWEAVVKAVLQKYPNSQNDRVESIDTLAVQNAFESQLERMDKSESLFIYRLMGTKWNVPGWILRFAGINRDALVHEAFGVFPQRKIFTHVSENVSFSSIIKIKEMLVYSQLPNDTSKTELSQTFSVELPHIPGGLTEYFEKMILDSNQKNIHKGRRGLLEVIKRLETEES